MANTHFISLIVATFFLFLFLAPPITNAQVQDIFDMNGDVVVVGRKYYILPVVQRRGGGISMAPKSAIEKCPLYVAQETNTTFLGLPVVFYRAKPASRNVTFSTDMNIIFASWHSTMKCRQSPVWTLKKDKAIGTRFVGLGGLPMVRGSYGVNNWFKIERFFPRFHFDYKFHFCPDQKICSTCNVECGDLGVYVQQDGTWRLGVGAPPLRVKFMKA